MERRRTLRKIYGEPPKFDEKDEVGLLLRGVELEEEEENPFDVVEKKTINLPGWASDVKHYQFGDQFFHIVKTQTTGKVFGPNEQPISDTLHLLNTYAFSEFYFSTSSLT